jgi:hypothetical protein
LQFPDDQPLQTKRAEPQAVKEPEKNKTHWRRDAALENHPSEEAKSEQSGESGRSTVTREEEEKGKT